MPFSAYDLTTPDWIEKWKKELNHDPEKAIHSWELYAVWGLKQEFVHRAIGMNKYNSTYFVWCDIGCFREPKNFLTPPRFAEITPSRVPPGHILILKIHEIDNSTHIGGGVLAGDMNAWRSFREAYLNTLHRFMEHRLFYGKDQTIYRFMLERKYTQFHVVETSGEWGRGIKYPKFSSRWFYLTEYLSTM